MPTPTNTPGADRPDEMEFDRDYVTGKLLELQFDDDAPYTREELEELSDDELIDIYNKEMFDEAVETEVDLETCSNCGAVTVCPFEDAENNDAPLCNDCGNEAEELEDADELAEDLEPEDDDSGDPDEDDDREDED